MQQLQSALLGHRGERHFKRHIGSRVRGVRDLENDRMRFGDVKRESISEDLDEDFSR